MLLVTIENAVRLAEKPESNFFYDVWMPLFCLFGPILFVAFFAYHTVGYLLRRLRRQQSRIETDIANGDGSVVHEATLRDVQQGIKLCKTLRVLCFRSSLAFAVPVLILVGMLIFAK